MTDVTAPAEVVPGPGRTLVAGIGNIFLTDDGFGVEVAARLAGTGLPEGVQVVDYGIRGMHLAYDLARGYDTAILVDATPRGGAPGTLYVIEPEIGSPAPDTGEAPPRWGEEDEPEVASPLFDAHGMQPDVVLGMLDTLGGRRPGRILIVGCEPASVDYGMGLSEPVAAAVDQAAALVIELVTAGPPEQAAGDAGPAGEVPQDAGSPAEAPPAEALRVDGAQDEASDAAIAGAPGTGARSQLFTEGWTHVPRHSR